MDRQPPPVVRPPPRRMAGLTLGLSPRRGQTKGAAFCVTGLRQAIPLVAEGNRP